MAPTKRTRGPLHKRLLWLPGKHEVRPGNLPSDARASGITFVENNTLKENVHVVSLFRPDAGQIAG